ncbi:MAG: hypothetical protein ABWX59_03495, partial [Microbacteriaceae bacterium]
PMAAADIFCGECGFVARSVTDKFATGPRTSGVPIQAPPVTFVQPPPAPFVAPPTPPAPLQAPDVAEADAAEPELPELIDSDSISWFTDSSARQALVTPPEPREPVTPPAPLVQPAPPSLVDPVHQVTQADTARIDPVQLASLPRPDDLEQPPTQPFAPVLRPRVAAVEDVEATRIVRRTHGGDPFVLQFSTGENVTVTGSGLLGRNPQTQPGEYFDHIVPIFDPGKSVSKTHLEFGQDAGVFWVADRFSGNGSVVREPGTAPRRCEPGKRYRVTRGTRVDIGEQFLIVS